MTLTEELEGHPVFAQFLAHVLEQLMEQPEGTLRDRVMIHQRGGDWAAAVGYYEV